MTAITREWLAVEEGDLPLTIARGEGTGAGVVIVPSAFGVGPDLEAQMKELAADARVVVAIDPFFRDDPGAAPYDDMARAMKRVQGLDRPRAYRDLRAAIEWMRRDEACSSVVVLGICLGGPFALLAAADRAVDGVVTWHGTRVEQQLERAAEMRCPMCLHFGSADPVVPRDAVEAIRAAFAARPDVRVFVHEGATHGFSHRARPQAYDRRAEQAGMDAVRELVTETAHRA
jgi:carboxymethylenebutenolidase